MVGVGAIGRNFVYPLYLENRSSGIAFGCGLIVAAACISVIGMYLLNRKWGVDGGKKGVVADNLLEPFGRASDARSREES